MKQTKNQKGFTLIEVLIAAVIVSFGMLAMGTFLGNYMNKNTRNERVTQATVYAQQKVEELRAKALAGTITSAPVGSGGDTNLSGEALGNYYTRYWMVIDGNNPKTIMVLVSWDGTTTSENNVTLTTLVNDNA